MGKPKPSESLDTFFIANYYLKRPVNIITMMMGEWFCRATGIDDPDLKTTASAWSAKELILQRGYNKISNLPELFDAFNLRMQNAS